MSEFDLIRRYFSLLGTARDDVLLGVGDDCAILGVPPGRELLVSMDTLVEGRHFSRGAAPEALGHKALAVGLSDLAAMGAEPAWATLALTLPGADEDLLVAFARGFGALAARYGVQLVGGDTTAGPFSITVQVHGLAEPGRAIRRDGARAGDLVYVTGTPGDAGLALAADRLDWLADDERTRVEACLHRPEPRVAQGRGLVGLASAAIDVSDGLAADLGHIGENSGLGGVIERESLPLSDAMRGHLARGGNRDLPLAAGDDYELVFTVPPARAAALASVQWGIPVTCIGRMVADPGIRVREPDGTLAPAPGGYDHFR